MNDRERIFGAIRSALAPLKERASLPEVPSAEAWRASVKITDGGTWTDFERNFADVNGTFVREASALRELIVREGATCGYCDPKARPHLPEAFFEGLAVDSAIDHARIDDYEFGITLGNAAIAETGSIILKDQDTSDRLGALAPWIHIALVPRNRLYVSVTEAILALGDDPNSIFVTGPSKTADVEGILIEGVHGPGMQVCLPI